MADTTQERPGYGGWWCRACGGYVGSSKGAEHEPVDCIIELRTRLDERDGRAQ